MLKTAILGASGYTGFELLKILLGCPEVKLCSVTSRQYKGEKVSEVFPALMGFVDLCFEDTEDFKAVLDAELVFSALPHKTSQDTVARLVGMDKRVIDLSADFRLKDIEVYKEWYGEHKAANILQKAVYGMPELYKEEIKKADLVANPGCYPTGAILGLAPVLSKDLIDINTIVIDSKSGVSGAGRGLSLDRMFVEVNEGFKAYSVGLHRHTPEIEQELSLIVGRDIKVTFTPHLLPLNRGILSTIYADLKEELPTKGVLSIYDDYYNNEPFIRIMDEGKYPNISQVKGSNFCDIGIKVDSRTGRVVIITAIDNLIKGASGQAVQNMNIMYNLPEETGLLNLPFPV
jgi:N-acetyl-gamma-glutamyl-phosphate reductase